ncbi:MAG: glycoside hydrolase family 97 protein [Tannerellaceae bacterium]|nr:glycoside hydrolase family 97 protein [Tannerellaceae bacterium]
MKKHLLFIAFCAISGFVTAQNPATISSPDGRVQVTTGLKNKSPFYSISYNGKTFIEDSPLGLKTSIGDFDINLQQTDQLVSYLVKNYGMVNAKKSHIHYEANKLSTTYINEKKDTLEIIFQVSNNDIAFTYQVASPKKNNCIILSESTGFKLPSYTTTFITPQATPMIGWENTKPSYEEEYTYEEPVGTPSLYGLGYTYPALFHIGQDGWALISETGVDSRYAATKLSEGSADGLYKVAFPHPGENNGVGASTIATAIPFMTSWKTITVGETLKPIVESTITFDVVDPLITSSQEYLPGRASWSWIIWQDISCNYDDQIIFIDLAANLGLEYILIDALWDKQIGYDRMPELIRYAQSKGVDVFLWYNSNGYWNNAPQGPKHRMSTPAARKEEMKWLKELGLKGLKVDFFGGDKQETMRLYEEILVDANEYGLIINFHGCTLPRGWERMFPNFFTAEAVLASENLVFNQAAMDRHAYSATIIPFTRNTVGAMDFGPLFLNKRLSRDQQEGVIRRTTDVFELATAVLYFSPIQHLAVTPNNLDEQPDYVIDFIRTVPASWDEIRFIDGYPGKYCVLARRKGDQWYIVAVNGEKTNRTLTLSLPMLEGREINLLYDQKDRTAGFKTIKPNKKGTYEIRMLGEGGAVLFN